MATYTYTGTLNVSKLSSRCHFRPTKFSALNSFFFRKLAVLEVAREEEFSPLKNGKDSPSDSPGTAKRDLLNLHRNYVIKAGGKFINTNG